MKRDHPTTRTAFLAAICGLGLALLTTLRASPVFTPTPELVALCERLGGDDRDACLVHAYRRTTDANLFETRTIWPLAVGAFLRQGRTDDALRLADERLGADVDPAALVAYAATWVDEAMRADRGDVARAVVDYARRRGADAAAVAKLDESIAWAAHRQALIKALDRWEYAREYHEDVEAPVAESIDLLRHAPVVSGDVVRDMTIRFRRVDDHVFEGLLKLSRERAGFLDEAGADLIAFAQRRLERRPVVDLAQVVESLANDPARAGEATRFVDRIEPAAYTPLRELKVRFGVTAVGNGAASMLEGTNSNELKEVP